MKWIKKWKIRSESNPDTTYTVSQGDDGTYGCSCPRWTRTRHKIPDGECKHIRAIKAGEGWEIDAEPPKPPEITLAMCKEVTPKDDGTILTPLIVIGHTHFNATILYDLLRAGVPWSYLRERYELAKRNTRTHLIGYVRERGRCIIDNQDSRLHCTYTVVPCPAQDGLA